MSSFVYLIGITLLLGCVGLLMSQPINGENSNGVVVVTKSGAIRGMTRSISTETLNVFLGIPFAKPPVGDRRFKRPEPADKWSEVYNATQRSAVCMQALPLFPNQNEDCLYLNVWSPSRDSNDKNLPVMLWIHGGALTMGSGMDEKTDGSLISVMGNVVVVTVNYRLGPFGFLYFGDRQNSNLGFWDQLLAIKWVKENIEAFGGDADQITLFGESAGSWSVSAHLISPHSRGLAKRAIMQSGSILSQTGNKCPSELLRVAEQFANDTQCRSSEDPKDWMECMKKLPAEQLRDKFFFGRQGVPAIASVYGDEFLPMSARDALETGNFDRKVALLAGNTRDEGSFLLPSLNRTLFDPVHPLPITQEEAKRVLSQILATSDQTNAIMSVADAFYFNNVTESSAVRHKLADVLGEFMLQCPTILHGWWAARWNDPNTAPVYSYILTHKPTISPACLGSTWMGVCHGDDIPFTFGWPLAMPIMFTDADRELSREWIHIWSQWATNGTLPALGDSGKAWPSYRVAGDARWLSRVNTYHVELNPEADKMWSVHQDLKAHNCQNVLNSFLQFC